MKQAEDALSLALAVIGRTTPVVLNSGIYSHSWDGEEYDDGNNDVITIVGAPQEPITLQKVLEAFRTMQHQFEVINENDQGRSYFYEGLSYNDSTGEYEVHWGS